MLIVHPEMLKYEAELQRQIAENLKKIDLSKLARTTLDESGVDSFVYNIPVVCHIIHDYSNEYMTDDEIVNDLVDWNIVYAKQNHDTIDVIAPFVKYIGKVNIKFHLATKDPFGNPTKGITRHRSYLTRNGGDQAKFDDWDPSSYLNIWFINTMSASNGMAAAYAFFPSMAAANPYGDGVISLYNYAANQYGSVCGKTINHEVGHIFDLHHTWGDVNAVATGTCSDGGSDFVDDTPPTLGHDVTGCTPSSLFDTVCARNYFKVYTSHDGTMDSLVNYPDTVNAQNIMDYTYCAKMFTKGQVARMHAALNSSVGNRNNLWTVTNLSRTGALLPKPDMKPVPEFSATMNGNMQYFTCPATALKFTNKSWNDTVTKVKFRFDIGSQTIMDSVTAGVGFSTNVSHSFSQSGWGNVTMTATGNHSGDSTIVYPNCIYVADATATPGQNVVEEFDAAQDLAHWPIFNYYNNEFKWEPCTTAGFYDHTSMRYDGYDGRIIPAMGIYPPTGSPYGDKDDFYSIPFNLSSMASGNCNLNFWTSGASRSSNSLDVNDTLQIYYSYDHGQNWFLLKTYGRNDICNKGVVSTPYEPTSMTDWVPKTISIPTTARGTYVVFRFRYLPGCSASSVYASQNYIYSSGNNFYMDRLTISPYAAAVSNVTSKPLDIVVTPNPTAGNAYVVIRDADNTEARIIVSDITGKVVYTASQQVENGECHLEIPASAIAVKGIYMVQATTGNQTSTQKLVAY